MDDIQSEMKTRKWHAEYDPSKPPQFRFRVRLPGPGIEKIDHKDIARTSDACGYGQTLEEAFANALVELTRQERSARSNDQLRKGECRAYRHIK